MQLDRAYKIEKAASKDEERNDLRHVFISADNTAMATDGRMMAIVPCAVGQGEPAGKVTPDSIAYARKHTLGDGALVLHLVDDKTAVAEDTSVFPREMTSHTKGADEQLELIRVTSDDQGKAETYIKIIPPFDGSDIVLTINPSMLRDLADAMGNKTAITLYMKPNEEGRVLSIIRAHGVEGAIGAIMPMNPEDSKPNK